eukprot:580546-Pelagomonas_calceolata.AAC.5
MHPHTHAHASHTTPCANTPGATSDNHAPPIPSADVVRALDQATRRAASASLLNKAAARHRRMAEKAAKGVRVYVCYWCVQEHMFHDAHAGTLMSRAGQEHAT